MPTKKKPVIQRTEASENITEFNLTEVGKEKIKLSDLLKSLKKTSGHQTIKQQLKNASKGKKLEVPLHKTQADKIKRTIAYEKVSKEVKKWDSIVRTNRSAEQIVYPLKQPEFRFEPTEDYVKRFQSKNALEEEVSKLLKTSENVLDQNRVLTVAEEKALKAMSLDEAKARHGELRKMRALLSYKEAKARRQKRIKSKKYHRILKKEKMKKLMKEFEELQKTDPEAAKEKLQETDKLRILERMTLKHKSTGKWAKQQQLRAKYNPESRSALKEQMNLGKQLTDKVIPVNGLPELSQNIDLDDDPQAHDIEDGDLLNLYKVGAESTYAKVKNVISTVPTISQPKYTKRKKVDLAPNDESESHIDLIDESCERLQSVEDFDDITDTTEAVSEPPSLSPKSRSTSEMEKSQSKKTKVTSYLPETDFSSEVKLLSVVPNSITFGDEDIDDEDEGKMNIHQAFADEDLISEFREEKKAVVEKDKPEGIDTFLPGWGSWGGTGIKPSKRKRRRFFIKPPEIPVRRDDTLGNVIINEDKDKKAAIHQVSDLPFQYSSVDQFESIIRQPVGNTWNPETSFQKMIAPKVVTKLGKIIEPIDADDIALQKKPDRKKTFKKKSQKPKQHKGKRNKIKNK